MRYRRFDRDTIRNGGFMSGCAVIDADGLDAFAADVDGILADLTDAGLRKRIALAAGGIIRRCRYGRRAADLMRFSVYPRKLARAFDLARGEH